MSSPSDNHWFCCLNTISRSGLNAIHFYPFSNRFCEFRARRHKDLLTEMKTFLSDNGYNVTCNWDHDYDPYIRVNLACTEEDDLGAEMAIILEVLEAKWKLDWVFTSPDSLQTIILRRLQDRRYLVKALLAGVESIGIDQTRIIVERFIHE